MHKLQVNSVEGKGKLAQECVYLQVSEDIDRLSDYMICDSTYSENNKISNELRHTFWFPRKAVKKGDWIQLWTKTGKNTSWLNQADTTTHVFYWKLGHTVWNKDGDCAVLFKLENWKTKKA